MSIAKTIAAGTLGYVVGGMVGQLVGAGVGSLVNLVQEDNGVSEETQERTMEACAGAFSLAGAICAAVKFAQIVSDND